MGSSFPSPCLDYRKLITLNHSDLILGFDGHQRCSLSKLVELELLTGRHRLLQQWLCLSCFLTCNENLDRSEEECFLAHSLLYATRYSEVLEPLSHNLSPQSFKILYEDEPGYCFKKLCKSYLNHNTSTKEN